MLKSEQLDVLLSRQNSRVESRKLEAKEFHSVMNCSIALGDDTSKDFLEDDISETRPFSQNTTKRSGPPKPPISSTMVKSPRNLHTEYSQVSLTEVDDTLPKPASEFLG